MISKSKLFLLITVLFLAAVAAADMFEYTWVAPDAQAVDLTGKKIAVFVRARDRRVGLAAEESIAADITARGAQGIAGHSVFPDSELKDVDTAKTAFTEEGLAGIVVIQGETKGKVPLDPNVWKDKTFWEEYGIKSSDDQVATSQPDVKIYLETRIYSLSQNKLIWIGSSETKVSQMDDFIKKLIPVVGEEFKKQGLIKQK